ncbi:Protein NLRC3 [Gigaspora margarita]|uniref:Protein NLRC3 n=1 Tax=Gigaspora margarita TaxID=4874 RepID=A0A8H4A8C4_GIGMA|nr:Protein NLRC3 [Gigaspora margarita]
MVPLSNECFFEILKYLENNYKSLFSCLLINRQWFRLVVPILWSKPLNHFFDSRIIRIYLSFLNSDEQIPLIPLKFKLPIYQKKPLVDYTIFIISFQDDLLSESIIEWIIREGHDPQDYHYITPNMVQVVKCSLIAMLLRKSEKLKSIDIHGFTHGIFVKTLVETLYRNTTIKDISIHSAELGFNDVKSLANALIKNNTLNSLKIGYDLIGDHGKLLIEALHENTTISSLSLYYLRLDHESIKAISNVLLENSTLVSLDLHDLSYNQLGIEGGKAISNALWKINSTITYLNLGDISRNEIDSEEGIALAWALRSNSSLTSLDLSIGEFGSEKVVRAIIKSLRKNISLTSLNFHYSDFDFNGSDDDSDELDLSLFRNINVLLGNLRKDIRKDIEISFGL